MTFYTYHDDPQEVDPTRVLVFGTSLKGDMKLGFGPIAVKKHGAQKGKTMGYNTLGGIGHSFAIPYKDALGYDIRTMEILKAVDDFITYSVNTRYNTYHITDMSKLCPRIQPGIIPYLFKGCFSNCIFPQSWEEFIEPEPKLIEDQLELDRTLVIPWVWE